jgi:phospholipid/cholesterol/gamma-HCH transport system substrate-binding protein
MAARSRVRPFLVGIAGIAVIALVLMFGITASSGIPGVPTTVVKAAFSNVGASLKVGDDVRENGSRIGRVSAMDSDGRRGVVTLELDGGGVPVYADARAAVNDTSALAKKFVELDRGHEQAGPLGEQVIPENRNADSGDLDQVLNTLDPATRDALTGTLREAGSGAAGHSRDLHDLLEHAPAILDGTGTITSALASKEADLPSLLQRADQLAGSLHGHEEQLSTLVDQAGATMRAVGVDDGKPLEDTVQQLPATLESARGTFDALNKPLDDTEAALAGLRPGLADLGKATPDLRGVLTGGRAPLDKVPGVAGLAQPAVEDLTATVRDARPLIPVVSRGLTDVANPVNTLAAYTNEVAAFFQRLESMTSTSVSPGVHGARVAPSVGGALLTGGVLPHLLEGQNPYPAPGQADRDHTASPLNALPGGKN